MKKILTILLALLIFGAQQGVASEKRAEKIKPTRQTKLQKEAEKGDGIAKGVLEALNPAPINIVAVHEFLQNEGYAPEWRESGEIKYVTFKYQDLGISILIDEDFVLLCTALNNLTPAILAHTKEESLSNIDLAYIYQTAIETSRSYRMVKVDYNKRFDDINVEIQVFIPSMNVFKQYFNLYMTALKLASDGFEKSLNEKFGIK